MNNPANVYYRGKYSLHTSQVGHQARAYLGFCNMEYQGIFLPPWMGC